MKDEFFFGGNKYISSKRAAKLTGYTYDYVGQLAREGKIHGRIIGRAKFVDEKEILEYKKESIINKERESAERSVKYKKGRKVPISISNTRSIQTAKDARSGSKPPKEKDIVQYAPIPTPYISKLPSVLLKDIDLAIVKKSILVALLPFFVFGVSSFTETPYILHTKNTFEKTASAVYYAADSAAAASLAIGRQTARVVYGLGSGGSQTALASGGMSGGALMNTGRNIALGVYGATSETAKNIKDRIVSSLIRPYCKNVTQ